MTYGVHGSRSVLADGRVALSLSTDVSEGAAGLAVSTLLAELENIAEGKITEGEIDAIKLQKALASGRDLRSSASVSNLLKSSIRSEQTFEQMAGWPKRLAAVNAASLSDVFSECAGQEIVTLLGDAESIRFSLAEVGIEATVMDWRATRDRDMQTYAPKRYKKELRERQKSP